MKKTWVTVISCLLLGLTFTGPALAKQTNKTVPWWDNWPRFTNSGGPASEAQLVNADSIIVANGLADEGRGTYFRETQMNQAMYDDMKARGIKKLAWLEGMGETRAIISAVHQYEDGSYEMDTVIGAPKLISHNWSWDFTGPDVNPDANKIVWSGVHSYVNREPWQGKYALGDELPVPTYPDGRPATGYFDDDASDPRKAKFYDAMASKDINGGSLVNEETSLSPVGETTTGKLPYQLPDGRTIYTGDLSFGKDLASPWWVEYNRLAAKYFIEHGADGFWVDNSTGWDFIGRYPVQKAFGEWSVATFRDFLRNHPEVVVTDVDSFDIRTYLKDKFNEWYPDADPANVKDWENVLGRWGDPRWMNDPVWNAFKVHKAEIAARNAQKLYASIKSEAFKAGKNPDDIYVGGNDIPRIHFAALTGNELDMVNTEYSPFYTPLTELKADGLPPVGHAGPFYDLAAQSENSRHTVVWYYLHGPHGKYAENNNLGELLGYEALSNNAILVTGDANAAEPGTRVSAKKVNDTIEKMAPVFGQRERAGSVGIVYSTQTEFSYLTPGGFINSSQLPHVLGYYGWGTALEELHVPYRAIPDFKLAQNSEHSPDQAALSGISVLILPNVLSISEETVENVLKPFVRKGGTVIVSGEDSGILDTSEGLYKKRSSAILYDLTQSKFNHGKAIFVEGNPGGDYYTSVDRASALETIRAIMENLEKQSHWTSETKLSGFGPHVLSTMNYDAGHKRLFVDLVNCNIDLEQDAITPENGGTIRIKVPNPLSGSSTNVKMYDPDLNAPITLVPRIIKSHLIEIDVPSFRIYTSLVVEKSGG